MYHILENISTVVDLLKSNTGTKTFYSSLKCTDSLLVPDDITSLSSSIFASLYLKIGRVIVQN